MKPHKIARDTPLYEVVEALVECLEAGQESLLINADNGQLKATLELRIYSVGVSDAQSAALSAETKESK